MLFSGFLGICQRIGRALMAGGIQTGEGTSLMMIAVALETAVLRILTSGMI